MIEYKIDRSQGIIFITVFDSTSVAEVAAHFQYMFDDPHFRPNYHIVAKIEKDTIIDPRLPEETETVQSILMDYAEKRNGSKCAIVIEDQTNRELEQKEN